jgi:release factor glutamine methyltransferase
MNLAALLVEGRRRLVEAGIADPALDARLLVEHFSGTNRADAIGDPDRDVGDSAAAAIAGAIERRLSGEPVHRIIGFRDFYGLRLRLSPGTLEPRPDTETLVDLVLPFVRETAAREGICRILDLGTGTGAIALALLSEVGSAVATGADLSDDALATARRNAADAGLDSRFCAVRSDWFSDIFGIYHLIVANPPYIRSDELVSLQAEVRDFDPLLALDGGEDGLDPYRMIAARAAEHLEEGGRIGVEIGYDQKTSVIGIFLDAGYGVVAAGRDLAGHDRALLFGR